MTTHQLADLFDALRTGLGASLKNEAVKGFEEVAAAFRGLPDQPAKSFFAATRRPAEKSQRFDVNGIAERIEHARAGDDSFDSLALEVGQLNVPQLKAVLAKFGVKGTTGKEKNRERVIQLFKMASNGQEPRPLDPFSQVDAGLVEQAVRLFCELKEDPQVSILRIRAEFEPIRRYPKPVVEEISRRVGYPPGDTREQTFDRMLQNLEAIKMSQLRSKMILS